MSKWVEKFQNHPFHDQFKILVVLVDDIINILENDQNSTTDEIEGTSRLKQIYDIVKLKLRNVEPSLVPSKYFDSFVKIVNDQINYLNTFNSTRNVSYINNSNDQADELLRQVMLFYSPISVDDIDKVHDAVIRFRQSTGQLLRNIKDEKKSLELEINELSKNVSKVEGEIKSQKNIIDNTITNFQKNFSDSETNRSNQFTSKLELFNSKFEVTESKRKEEFEAAFSSLMEKFQVDTSEALIRMEKQISESRESLKTYDNHMQDVINKYFEDLEKYKEQAQNIVHVIGNTGMVGGYQKVANEEKRITIIWNIATVIAMCSLIGFAVFAYLSTFDKDASWIMYGGRAFVAVACGILAAYAAQQANKHNEVERYNRRMELELASIDPYLVNLPEELQNDVKKALAERMFGQKRDAVKKIKNDTTGTLQDVIKQFVESLVESLKK